MNRKEAKAVARSMRKAGHPFEEIAAELTKRGYVSERTGKPLSMSGTASLITYKPTTKGKAAVTGATPRKRAKGGSDRSMLEVVHRLLNSKMPADERIAACSMLIEGQLR